VDGEGVGAETVVRRLSGPVVLAMLQELRRGSGRRSRPLRCRAGAVAGALAGALAGACAPAGPSVVVDRAVIVLPAGNAPAALYFTIRNNGVMPDTLLALSVDVAGRTSMHTELQHQMALGAMSIMTPVAFVPIADGSAVRFAPGELHGMVEELRRPLVRGDSVRMSARLAHGAAVATVHVVAYADLDSALAPPSRLANILAAVRRLAVAAGCTSCDRSAIPSIGEGRTLYLANGCATCHGPGGQGDGPLSRTLNPPPRDFRDATAFKNGVDPSSIAQTIAEGIAVGGAMPRFAHLTDYERRSLALYVISLRDNPPARTEVP